MENGPGMIKVNNLAKYFGRDCVLNDVSFSVEYGQVAGLLGPNGAGKTTLMRIIAGYMAPNSGSVMIDGLDVFDYPVEARRRLGYLPENAALYPDMRVDEYLSFRAALKGVRRRDRSDRIEQVKALCGLREVGRRIIGRLSRGFWQRIALADAMVHDPKLLILDEPTIGLDPYAIRNVRELIKNLGSRYTVLLSTHLLSEVEMICSKVFVLNGGGLVATGSPGSLGAAGLTRVRAELMGPCNEVVKTLELIPGIKTVSYQPSAGKDAQLRSASAWGCYFLECEAGADVRSGVFDVAGRMGWPMRELAAENSGLERTFIELTMEGREK